MSAGIVHHKKYFQSRKFWPGDFFTSSTNLWPLTKVNADYSAQRRWRCTRRRPDRAPARCVIMRAGNYLGASAICARGIALPLTVLLLLLLLPARGAKAARGPRT